ncbi:MASE1 protein [Atopomonas hussainii]|uniref:histidine kinase n=1 Tax=Atopomonas hussainii TaxID=1429083 RepID=A0A1H7FNC9_9GAMM|nr:HAMP domain-containing sensor histidine kinase [Atopomonas hussainii]SEK27461.1 MASE1 protein [Atopomonas hussainii]
MTANHLLRLPLKQAAPLAACGYCLFGMLGIFLSQQPGAVAAVWYANAFAVAMLLAAPRADWLVLLVAIALGNAAANWFSGDTLLHSVQFVPGNLLEISVTAWLLRRIGILAELAHSPLALLQLLALAGALTPMFGAALGAAVLKLTVPVPYAELWLSWYQGDVLGMITLLPLLLALRHEPLQNLRRFGWPESLSLLVLCQAVTLLALTQLPFPFALVMLPLLLCAMLAPVLLTGLAVWLTGLTINVMLALGHFIPPPITAHWQSLWTYVPIVLTVLAPLLLASALEQSRQRQRELSHQGRLLEEAGSLASLGAWEQHWPSGKVYWSAQLAHILGQSQPRTWESLMPHFSPASRQLLLRALQKASVSGAPWELELDYAPNEQVQAVRVLQLLGRVESHSTGQQRWWGVVRDITAQKELDQLKSQFVATVSHELRTPLTAMRGALDLLSHTQAEHLPEAGRNLLDIAARNTKRLGELVNLILDLEKLRAGRLEVHAKPLDMVAAVRESLVTLEPYAAKYQVRFVFQPPAQTLYALGDELRVQQVLSNLLSNAAKFADTGSQVLLSLNRDSEGVRLSVTNQGPPIEEAFRAHIFQPFRQADGSDRRQREGTGLGLSISRALVEAMKGEIGFTSDAEQGTCFWFRLLAAE